jgi:hypothetical protein
MSSPRMTQTLRLEHGIEITVSARVDETGSDQFELDGLEIFGRTINNAEDVRLAFLDLAEEHVDGLSWE